MFKIYAAVLINVVVSFQKKILLNVLMFLYSDAILVVVPYVDFSGKVF